MSCRWLWLSLALVIAWSGEGRVQEMENEKPLLRKAPAFVGVEACIKVHPSFDCCGQCCHGDACCQCLLVYVNF